MDIKEKIQEVLDSHDQGAHAHVGECVEPGYGSEPMVIFSELEDEKLTEQLEELGSIHIAYHDEWSQCCNCLGWFRTQADSYGWTPSYLNLEGSDWCGGCLDSNPDVAVDYCMSIAGQKGKAIHSDLFDPDSLPDYVQVNQDSFESGWHPHQTDDPEGMRVLLITNGITAPLFVIDGVGQFDVDWSLWVPKNQLLQTTKVLEMEVDDSE